MRRFRKSISLILSVALLISTMVFGFGVSAAETGTLLSEGQEGLLRYLNVTLAGNVISYEKQITRGEMAHILARVSNIAPYTGEGSYFYDVPMTYLYAKDILALVDAGVLHGDGDGNYRPNDPISDAEIAKVFVATLGYKNLEDMATYQKVARQAGITEGTVIDGIVTYAEALQMAYNTLHSGMFEGILYGEDPMGKVNEDFTALEMYHGLVYHEGVMDGISGSTLTHAEEAIESGQIRINGKIYTYADESLVGHAVIYYVKRADMDENRPEIQYLYSDEEWTTAITLDAKDIIGRDSNGKFKYYVEDDEREVKIAETPYVIYNGVAYPQCSDAEMKPGAGIVTLIDNNGDRIYDVLNVTAYEYMVVDSVNPDDNVIYGKYPQTVIGSSERDCDLKLKYGSANAYLGVIQNGDVIALVASKNPTGTLKIRIDILAAGTPGAIEGVVGNTYTIGGKVYERTSGTTVDSEPKVGETVTVYTHKGNCAAIIHAANDAYQYGYLLNVANRGTVFSSKIRFQLSIQGTLAEYDLADKVYIDETPVDASEFDNVANPLETAANLSYREGAENMPYAQLLRYRLNNDGLITHIDTATYLPEKETKNSLRLSYSMYDDGVESLQYEPRNAAFINRSDSIESNHYTAFIIPTNGLWRMSSVDRDNMDFWTTGGLVERIYYKQQHGIFEAYNIDPDTMVARMVIMYEANAAGVTPQSNETGRPGIVMAIEKVLDKDGIPVTQLQLGGITAGTTTLILPDDVSGADTLAIGDVIDVTTSNGEVVAMNVLYTLKDGMKQGNPYKKGDFYDYRARCRLAYGTPISFKDGYLRHTTSLAATDPTDSDNDGDFFDGASHLYSYRTASATYYLYDSQEPEKGVQTAGSGKLMPYSINPRTPQKVILCSIDANLAYVYIIQ